MNPPTDPLENLRALALPELISWWPLALGWWILLLLIVMLLLGGYIGWKKHTAGHWRKEAKLELETMKKNFHAGTVSPEQLISQSSQLLRRVALSIESREKVASLHGENWLAKLDSLAENKAFTQGVGRCFAHQLWQSPQRLSEVDLPAVIELVEQFVNNAKPSTNNAKKEAADD
jgi:hypothetical protein